MRTRIDFTRVSPQSLKPLFALGAQIEASGLELDGGNFLEAWTIMLLQTYLFGQPGAQVEIFYVILQNWALYLERLEAIVTTMLMLKGDWAIYLMAIVWSVASLGILIKLLWPKRLQGVTTGLYIALGWVGIIAIEPIFASLGVAALVLSRAGNLRRGQGTVGKSCWWVRRV